MISNDYSVALCTYNGAKYIEEQLESILRQTIPPKEIIISDDGSQDLTLSIAHDALKKSDVMCKIVKNQGQHGVTSNFQNAISLCTQKYIFTSDQDDVWLDKKAETMLGIFNEQPRALLVFSNGELVDGDLKPLHCSMWESVGITSEMLEKNCWFEYMLKRCFVTGAAMAFKKELFEEDESIPSCWLHDGWFAWKAVVKDGLIPCPEKLILYRQHGDNVVGMSSATSFGRVRRYLNNFKNMKKTHRVRYERYLELEEKIGTEFSPDEQKKLNDCISFWKDLISADNQNKKIEKIKIVLKHIRRGDFDKYFNGSKGAIREIVLNLVQ